MNSNHTTKISILGAGAWGTTLAWLFSNNNKRVYLWSHNSEKVDLLKKTRKVSHPVEATLPPSINISADLEEVLSGAGVIVFASNSESLRSVAHQARAHINSKEKPVLVSAVKGLALPSLQRMSQVISEEIPDLQVCALSGPNLAGEILQGLPAAAVIGCSSKDPGVFIQKELAVPLFRLYLSEDITGVELGGTLKNIIAIAAGVSDGLNLGVNSKSALLARGLAEMTRLALSLGAKTNTLSGLSGMGDLFATCTSALSRNYRLGKELSHGKKLDEVLASLKATAEGVPTTFAACQLSKQQGIELPIAQQVKAALEGSITPKEAIMALMKRPLSHE